jgi:hypothetical protein
MAPAKARPALGTVLLWLVAALSFGAAAIAAGVVVGHGHEPVDYGLYFVLLAWFQALWAVGVLLRPRRWVLTLGAVLNAVVIAMVVGRAAGLPVGPAAWQRNAAGALGVLATAIELLLVLLAAGLALHADDLGDPDPLVRPRAGLAAAAALVLAVTGVGSVSLANGDLGARADAPRQKEAAEEPAAAAAPMEHMADMPGMQMGTVDPSWRYTGPPLPAAETRLLEAVYERTEAGHSMQDASCTQAPDAQQQMAALDLVQRTTAAVAKYRDVQAAVADGYAPITNPSYPMVHYLKASYMQAQHVLDPDHVQSLVYDRLPSGQYVLVAAMYLMPTAGEDGPTPGGCLTQWHAHTNLCMSLTLHRYQGFAPCPDGTVELKTPEMLHVWQVPVPGGPLAMDPTDLQVMQAAVMATGGAVAG